PAAATPRFRASTSPRRRPGPFPIRLCEAAPKRASPAGMKVTPWERNDHASQSLPMQALEVRLVDADELDSITGSQRQVAVGDTDRLQGRRADGVPAAWTDLRVYAGRPPRQPHAARLDAQARRGQAGHPTQRRRQVAEIGKTRTEADGVHRVDSLH